MERKTEANRMQFHFVTGTCKNCGGNKFRFDPKEQTFVCEYCQTEVYAVSPMPEKEEEPDDKRGEGDKASVEPLGEEKPVYSGYGDRSYISAIFSMIAGTIMVFLRPILYETGFLEKMLSDIESSAESPEGVTPALTRASEIMETMIKAIGSDSFLTFSAVFGSVIIIMGTGKLIKSLMWRVY